MENQPLETKIVLKVNLDCCEACPKKLEKALFKLTGVSSHTIKTEEDLVSLSGTVDPDTIIKLIYKKLAKKAKLVSYEAQSTDNKEEKSKNTQIVEYEDSNNKNKSQHKEEMHKTWCCQDGSCPMMGNNVHKCEVYDPPPQDESSAYGYMPNYAQGYYGGANPRYPISGSYYPRWYPERPPAQYGYYPPPRRPQPPYGYY